MININYRDSRPIFQQVKDGFTALILSGALRNGDRIPSVRELAAQLAINPNTIQRAYRELESEGYICSVPGKGSFVSGCDEVAVKRRAELSAQLRCIAEEYKRAGGQQDELTVVLSEVFKGD